MAAQYDAIAPGDQPEIRDDSGCLFESVQTQAACDFRHGTIETRFCLPRKP